MINEDYYVGTNIERYQGISEYALLNGMSII